MIEEARPEDDRKLHGLASDPPNNEQRPKDRLSKTIGQIAAELPAAIPVFERYGLDYCCGGARTLEAACEDRRLPVETLRAEIAAAAALSPVQSTAPVQAIDWTGVPLAELCSFIVRMYHNRFRADLPLVMAMIDNARQTNPRYTQLLTVLRGTLRRFRAEFESHMRKEEQVLFPAIRQLEDAVHGETVAPRPSFGSFHNPVYLLESEHESLGAEIQQIRRITTDYAVAEAADDNYIALMLRLQALEMELHEHMHVENNVLFPRTIAMEQAAGLTKHN